MTEDSARGTLYDPSWNRTLGRGIMLMPSATHWRCPNGPTHSMTAHAPRTNINVEVRLMPPLRYVLIRDVDAVDSDPEYKRDTASTLSGFDPFSAQVKP